MISCGAKRASVTPAKALAGSSVTHVSPRPFIERDRAPHPNPSAASTDRAAAPPIDKPSNDVAATAVPSRHSPPAWSVTMIRTPAPPSANASPHEPQSPARGSSRVLSHIRAGRGLFLLAIGGAVLFVVILLLVRNRTPE